jgi:hypothetical protein
VTEITKNIWIGNSNDAEHADLRAVGIDCILNCAKDLECTRGWSDGLIYAKCGLVDGPGNTASMYHAAVLTLNSLLTTEKKVLVVCHDGRSRSVAVVMMCLSATRSRLGWDGWRMRIAALTELPENMPHEAHRLAFNRMNWRLINSVLDQ